MATIHQVVRLSLVDYLSTFLIIPESDNYVNFPCRAKFRSFDQQLSRNPRISDTDLVGQIYSPYEK